MSIAEESDNELNGLKEDSLSDVDDDFDHMIGLSPRSSTGGSYGNLKDPNNQCVPSTSTPEGHVNHISATGQGQSLDEESESVFVKDTDNFAREFKSQLHKRHENASNVTKGPKGHNVKGHTSIGHSNKMFSGLVVNGNGASFVNNHVDESSNGLLHIDTQSPHSEIHNKHTEIDNNSEEMDVDRHTRLGQNGRVSAAYDDCDGDDEEEDDVEEGKENPEMAVQLCQLQEIVGEMKSGFMTAMQALAEIQNDDQVLKQTVDSNREQYEKQMADVLQMVLSLKNEFSGVISELHTATDVQRGLRHQLESLQYERDILLEELERAGAVSRQLREKYHSGRQRPEELYHSQSSANLSGLLERARLSFPQNGHGGGGGAGGTGSQNSSHVTSDSGVTSGQVGDDETAVASPKPPVLSPMMDSYITQQHQLSQEEPPPLDHHDDSDSSLINVANKSLDLSRSLGDACAEDLSLDLSDDEKEQTTPGEKGAKTEPETSSCSTSPAGSQEPGTDDSGAFKRPLTPPSKLAPHERNAKEVQRGRVARELVETERTYCTCLWTLLDHFAARLRDSGMVASKDINVMFPVCLTRIYEHHCAFLQKLEDRLSNGKWQCVIGDVVSRFVESSECDLLTQYQNFMNEFPNALHCIRKTCRASSKFRKFLREAQQHPSCGGLDVGAFMLTPVQRVPRYVLLLKQLLRHTDDDHPDHYFLDSSLQKLGEFLTELNDSIETSMKLVQPEPPPKLKKRLRDRMPSFRRTNTESVLDTSSLILDSSMDSSTIASELDSRFISSPKKSGRPISVHGYPGHVMLTSAQSLQAIPVAVSQHDSVISSDTAYLVQDRTGRLIPVKHRKVKRASKSDLKHGVGLSSSFHSGTRPDFFVGSPGRPSPRRVPDRPHSMVFDSFPETSTMCTSTPAHAREDTLRYADDSQLDVEYSNVHEPVTSLQGVHPLTSSQLMPPPPLPLMTSGGFSPRSHAGHVHTNGSLSYHQNLRRIQNEYSSVYGVHDSESDSEAIPRQPIHSNNDGSPLIARFHQIHNNPNTISHSPQLAHARNIPPSHDPRSKLNQFKSQSVVEFKEPHSSFKSQSAVDFRTVASTLPTTNHLDSVSQHNINVALARSLNMHDEVVSNPSPVSLRSTHSNPGNFHAHSAQSPTYAPQFPHPPPPQTFEYKSQLGNIDRPGGKLTAKRHSLKQRFESPSSPSLTTVGSLATSGSEVWHQGMRPDSWSNTSSVSLAQQEKGLNGCGVSSSTSDVLHLDTSIIGSPRKELTKKQQKERQKKLAAQSVGDLGKKPKSSIRQSLKNMFFRKNEETDSRDVQQPIIEEENSKMNGSATNILDNTLHHSMTSLQTTPTLNRSYQDDDDSLVISNVTHDSNTITLSYEEADPCSAV